MEVNGVLVAAHELKAPLCLMRQLTLALQSTSEPTRVARLQSQLLSTSERALRQITDFSKVARLEDGLFASEPVSVRAVCEEVLHELTPLFLAEHRQLKAFYTNKSRLAVANRDLLFSIIYNFCTNALHYSQPDLSSELSISDYHGKIRIGVRDYGPALPAKIWRELKTGALDQPTAIAMRPGSSGLGLYIASQFASHMHTRLGAIRHRDGTSFFIDLVASKQLTLSF